MPSCNTYSYLGFCYLGHWVSFHGCSSKAQPLLLTLDEGYLLTTALPDLQCGIAPLGPPVHAQPWLPITPLIPTPASGVGCSSWPSPLASGLGAWGSSSRLLPLTSDAGYLLSAAPPRPDLGRGVAPLCRSCAVAVWYSWLLPLTSYVG